MKVVWLPADGDSHLAPVTPGRSSTHDVVGPAMPIRTTIVTDLGWLLLGQCP